MSETSSHGKQISQLREQLEACFSDDPCTFVAADVFIYYREGDPSARVAPDVMVARGVREQQPRSSYFTWIEGKPPDVVFEFLSDKTAIRDRQIKPDLYLHEIGVTEQFLWQPRSDRRRKFQGWRRLDGHVADIVPESFILTSGEMVVAYYCETLDLWLVEERGEYARLLRLYWPDGTPVPTLTEAMAQVEVTEQRAVSAEQRAAAAEQQAAQEAAARNAAQTELAQLRQELAQLRGERLEGV